ncbi:MAG: lamin tail domain-containing protein [Bacteroidales bacterium]|nr:lamin tail domain-containing protein [Bacteroidales bacterium]MCF8404218.1 lamin tail domain-containing protein [Bacteroidales bacterium]
MRKTKLSVLLAFFLSLGYLSITAQTPFYTLDFETAGGYTTSIPEFSDGSGDFFIRTDGSNISTSIVYSNVIGTYFFTAMDIDGDGAIIPAFLDINDIDISGQSNLIFSVYIAEDDDAANNDWDLSDYVHFYYDLDNSGTFTNLLWIENDGSTFNSAPYIDTDFDGTGDGTEITDVFTQFMVSIPTTGSFLDIKIEFNLDAGDEDIGIDQIQMLSGTGPMPLNANFVADQTNVPEGTLVTFSDLTTGGTPAYTYAWDLDGDGQYDDSTDPNPSFTYSTAGTYTVALKVIDGDLTENIETKTDYITVFTITNVGDLVTLRSGTLGSEYTVTGEVVLTFQQTFRNQKFIQDGTAAILIDDPSGIITSTYAIYDGITGITGTLAEYGGMMQLIPSVDPGAPTSVNNVITPQPVTLTDLTGVSFENYESELVKISDVTFADAGLTFANGTVYAISDPSKGTFNFRTTFYDVNYIATTIPGTANITVIPNSRPEGNFVTARALADFEIAGLPTIDKAYAISSTEVDVYYNIAPPSVDPGDYYITGTSVISFSTATVDGVDPKIIHLSGASVSMAGDLTVDELFDDAYGSSYVFYAGILPIAYTNTNNPGGTISNDTMATFQGIVSANDAFNNVWVSDLAGQYNGILIYDVNYPANADQGDEVVFAGIKDTYLNVTEIKNAIHINTVSTGNTPYGPDIIPGSDIDENIGADLNPAEAWEGQLVKIENFTVESYGNYDYKCSWSDADVTYYFHVGDQVDYHFGTISMTVGSSYQSITGVVDWDYDSTFYRINPRTQADIQISSNPATKLAVVSVNNGFDPYLDTDFDVVVQAQDAGGSPALVTSDINFTFTTDGGDIGNVVFVTGTSTTGTLLNGTSEVTITGVQMTPTGTNVTITASDNAIFGGLTAGTSAPFDVIELIIPEIYITEIMQNPSAVGDTEGEWFEVYNNGDAAVDMLGWTIKDDGTNTHTIATSVNVPAKGFAVLGLNDDPLTNGGVTLDYMYSGFTLGNSDDEVVLLLPDGITEVDRVNYDGGPVWPDPAGASMTFTGFVTDENNDGTQWVYSTLREGNYDNSADDKGSPGSDGYDQILSGGFKLDLKVYLENAFVNADSMSNYFRANSMLPYYHPFDPVLPYYGNNTPYWLLSGNDTLSFVPFLTTDWLMVELRDATSANTATGATTIGKYPVLLSDTGVVVSMNGSKPLNVKQTISNDLFIVVYSINHLAVMNPTGLSPVEGTTLSYDFSTGSEQYLGGVVSSKELSPGVWGMLSGDINGDKIINGDDFVNGWAGDAGKTGAYQGNNLFLDDQVDNKDKNEFVAPNAGMSSTVPD